VFENRVSFLGFYDFFYWERENFILFAMICKYMIHFDRVCFVWVLSFTETWPKFWEHHPLLVAYWYGASLGGSLCDTSKMYVRWVRLTSHESEITQKHKQHDKYHHHGGGAARPSSGVVLMNPSHLRGGRPCACWLWCRRWSDSIDSIN